MKKMALNSNHTSNSKFLQAEEMGLGGCKFESHCEKGEV